MTVSGSQPLVPKLAPFVQTLQTVSINMRKLLLLIIFVAAAYWGYTRYFSNTSISESLHFPTTIAWREVEVLPQQSGARRQGLDVVVAIDGGRWREETLNRRGKVFVAVFDGQRAVCSNPQAPADKLDPTIPIRMIFASLPKSRYEGIEVIDGRSCWRYTGNRDGLVVSVWIDSETHFPARVVGPLADGSTGEERYSVLPIDVRQNAGQIFNTNTSVSVFRSYLH